MQLKRLFYRTEGATFEVRARVKGRARVRARGRARARARARARVRMRVRVRILTPSSRDGAPPSRTAERPSPSS